MPVNKFLIPHRDVIHVVDYSSILFFKSDNCYSHIHLMNGNTFVLIKSLSKVEREVEDNGFIRISQSFLVNVSCITGIHKKQRTVTIGSHILPFTMPVRELVQLLAR
ncbi:LytR/AlgR family response regulator transcription factor [Chitinophaga rhizophila]|uniref:LytTR family transcriptional regulator n=1 Tax=Chitinophaga rhizophila TaxID=2866212 RepID=A0ABS7G8D4_9BACT|nr:LytTR family DNA-binding domain-containing protein [Chitinophaga rhizophila]MBW8683565.1 LytTR family transcriptional regulator [Chitinophaga rhizophila]